MMVPDSVNGHELQEGQPMPWMALITQGPNYHNHFRCGGSLVNNQFVLTAAHCFCGDALMCDTPLSTCSHLQPNETHPSIKLRVRETVFGFGCASIKHTTTSQLKVFLLILQKHAFVKHVLVFLGMTHTQFSEIGANDLETKHARIAMRVQKIFIHPLLCTKKVTTHMSHDI